MCFIKLFIDKTNTIMKYFLFLLFTSIAFLSFSQRYFSSTYYFESVSGAEDGSIKVEFHNHDNPVNYVITVGTGLNQGGTFDFATVDSIAYTDSMTNIGVDTYTNTGLFSVLAIDAVTNDTLGSLKSLYGLVSVGNVSFEHISNSNTNSSCNGAFKFVSPMPITSDSLTCFYSLGHTSSVSGMGNIFNSRDSMELNNLCNGYYILRTEVLESSFYIDPIINTISDSLFNSSVSVSTTADSSNCEGTAIVTVNSTSSPYLYSVDGETMGASNSFDSLCTGLHYVVVVNSVGDTAVRNFYIANLSNTIVNPNNYGTVVDTLYFDTQNCSFDYNQVVDSAYITNSTIIDSNSVFIEVSIFQGGNVSLVSDTISFTQGVNGSGMVDIYLYCELKSSNHGHVLRIIDFINLQSSSSTNVDKVKKNKVLIYPNPFIDKVTIEGDKPLNIVVFNTLGEVVFKSNNNNLDLKSLNSGIYFVNLTFKEGTQVYKIIKK